MPHREVESERESERKRDWQRGVKRADNTFAKLSKNSTFNLQFLQFSHALDRVCVACPGPVQGSTGASGRDCCSYPRKGWLRSERDSQNISSANVCQRHTTRSQLTDTNLASKQQHILARSLLIVRNQNPTSYMCVCGRTLQNIWLHFCSWSYQRILVSFLYTVRTLTGNSLWKKLN